jgi:uncharacterized membrane protein YfcA
MSIATTVFVLAVMVFTAFLSGIFGMAGGLVLVGVLLAVMPLPDAMALHAVTQMASNGWRGFLWRRHIVWRPVLAVVAGSLLALGLWSAVRYVPEKPVALLALGITPFLVKLVPERMRPNPHSPAQGVGYGLACSSLMLLTGVSGPLLDRFFLGGGLDRREIIATKAVCQVIGHLLKLVFYAGVVEQGAGLDPLIAGFAILCSMLGTTLARRILEAMTDTQYRRWTDWIIACVSAWYIGYGGWLLVVAR